MDCQTDTVATDGNTDLEHYPMLALLGLAAPRAAHAQEAPSWFREAKTDQLTGAKYIEFTLLGKFLTAPSGPHPDVPALVARCEEGSYKWGRFHGKLLAAYVLLGSIVDATGDYDYREAGLTPIRFRLDDGKVHTANWGHSTNYAALTVDDIDLDTLLYGHFMPHKENTAAPVRKIVISAPEYLGADVVVQFDMPDPSAVAEVCGVTRYKR